MKNSTNSTESQTDSNQTPEETKKTETEVTHDDLGYEVEKGATPPAKEENEEKKEDETPEEVEKPATGYEADDEEEEEEKPEEKKEDEKKDEELSDEEKAEKARTEGIKEIVKSLGESFSKEKIEKFAIENNFTKEQVEAYVKFAKDDETEAAKTREKVIKETRKAWKQELMSDKEFGGEDGKAFDLNVKKVNVVLEKNFPGFKKALTEKGTVLPPYLMKDLLSVHKILNPKNPLDQGEPKEEKQEGNFLDEFYS